MISVILLIIAILGWIVYFAIDHPKVSNTGYTVFWTALLAFFLNLAGFVKLIL